MTEIKKTTNDHASEATESRSPEELARDESPADERSLEKDHVLNRVIKRMGGRHLIFRTQIGKRGILPRPYALISTFRGPIWLFYGAGQIWMTHKKYHEFDGWMSRIPRIPAPPIVDLIDRMDQPLKQFVHYCNEHGVEGTIVIDPQTIDFHWTFGYDLEKEKTKTTHTELLDAPFQQLVDHFLAAQHASSVVE